MELADILTAVIHQREEQRGRMWSLMIPFAAGFVAVGTYVTFHLPQLTMGSLLSVIAFAILLFVSVDWLARLMLVPLWVRSLIPNERLEEKILERFRRLPDEKRADQFDLVGRIIAYLLAAAVSLIFGYNALDDNVWLSGALFLGMVVFFASGALLTIQKPRSRRAQREWKHRIVHGKALRMAVAGLRGMFMLSFGVVTIVILQESWSQNREDAAAVAGIVAAILLALVAARIWLTVANDRSTETLADIRYRLATGELSESVARKCYETSEILRDNRLFYIGSLQEFIKDMKLQPGKSGGHGGGDVAEPASAE